MVDHTKKVENTKSAPKAIVKKEATVQDTLSENDSSSESEDIVDTRIKPIFKPLKSSKSSDSEEKLTRGRSANRRAIESDVDERP
jgi:hypothetical protein